MAFKCSTQRQAANLGQRRLPAAASADGGFAGSECLGAETLLQLLKNYARASDIKTAITVGGCLPTTGSTPSFQRDDWGNTWSIEGERVDLVSDLSSAESAFQHRAPCFSYQLVVIMGVSRKFVHCRCGWTLRSIEGKCVGAVVRHLKCRKCPIEDCACTSDQLAEYKMDVY